MDHYTIATLFHEKEKSFLIYSREGSKYKVVYIGKGGLSTVRRFDSTEKAIKAYQQIAEWMLSGTRSDSDRRRYLMTGKMK